jgi:hypothetical protein
LCRASVHDVRHVRKPFTGGAQNRFPRLAFLR